MDDAFEKEEDELVVLLDYCLAHDIISNRHVAYQNLFRLLVCALNLQSKAPPNAFRELMNFDYERCNKFGLAAAEFEVGAGCSGNQQHHIDPKTYVRLHNSGSYSVRQLRRFRPPTNYKPGIDLPLFIDFCRGVQQSSTKACVAIGKKQSVFGTLAGDGMVIEKGLAFGQDELWGLAKGPVGADEAKRVLAMNADDLIRWQQDNAYTSEMDEVIFTTADRKAHFNVGCWPKGGSKSWTCEKNIFNDIQTVLRTCLCCLKKKKPCDSSCFECEKHQTLCETHRNSGRKWHYSLNVCSECAENQHVCFHLVGDSFGLDMASDQSQFMHKVCQGNVDEICATAAFPFPDAMHAAKSMRNSLHNHWIWVGDYLVSTRIPKVLVRDPCGARALAMRRAVAGKQDALICKNKFSVESVVHLCSKSVQDAINSGPADVVVRIAPCKGKYGGQCLNPPNMKSPKDLVVREKLGLLW